MDERAGKEELEGLLGRIVHPCIRFRVGDVGLLALLDDMDRCDARDRIYSFCML